MYCSSQRSDMFSQDEYLTPATQDNPTFVPSFALSSPSPIKKKSRSSRGSREMVIPEDVINEEDNEEDDDDPFQGGGGGAPFKARPLSLRGNTTSTHTTATNSTSCLSGDTAASSSASSTAGGGDGVDDYNNDFRSLSQGLSQSVVDGIGSLKMNGSSPEDEDGIMQCSQDAAHGFSLKSVGADWNSDNTTVATDALSARDSISTRASMDRSSIGTDSDELVKVVSIPPCSTNPFSGSLGAGNGGGGGQQGAGEGRKRHRQRKIKIPCRDAGGGSFEISRYLMSFDQLDTIGAGRFSIVYKCRKRIDGLVYAVKRSRHSIESEAEKEAAMREVFALAALQTGPQLVRYMDAWMEDKHLYIVTEFCPGGSLERAVFPRGFGGGPMPPPGHAAADQTPAMPVFKGDEADLLRVTRDIALALQFMHERGIVHMDVKPANILLASDGSFKLGDLGHAIKSDGSMMVAEGDERYLSMEVLKGLDLFKLSAGTEVPNYQTILGPNDVFGLGASLYEVTSRTPLASSGPEFRELREGQLRALPREGLSQGFQDLLKDMLAPTAQARPTAAQVAARAETLLAACKPSAEGSGSNSMPRSQEDIKRIQDLEEMVLSLTGLKN